MYLAIDVPVLAVIMSMIVTTLQVNSLGRRFTNLENRFTDFENRLTRVEASLERR